jgi:GNAT superfamily N-acetyltransferase
MLARGEGWGAFDGDRLVGKLTIDALPCPSIAHVFWIHAFYVHADARGAGRARRSCRRRLRTPSRKGRGASS